MNRLKKFLNKFLKGNFSRNVFIVAGGTAFTQILNALLTPIVTRIYTPEEYGVVSLYVAVLSMAVIVASLKFEWGIPIAEDDEKAINIVALSILVLISITTVVAILLFVISDSVVGKIIGEALLPYKIYIPIGIFLSGLYHIFMQWGYREKAFKTIAKTKLSQVIGQNVSRIGLGLLKLGPQGLIIGTIIGHSSGVAALSKNIFSTKQYLIKKIKKSEILWCAKRYKDYPIYSATSQFMNSAGLNLPKIFLATLYSTEVTGAFGLAVSITGIPVTLIGRSVGDVFYAEAASIGKTNPRKLKQLSNKLFKKLAAIGLIPALALLILGPFLFKIVYGAEWVEAGVYSRIMSVLIYARLVFLPISRVFAVMEKQRHALILDAVRLIFVLLVFSIAKWFVLDAYYTIVLYTVAMSLVYFATYITAQKIIDEQIQMTEDK
ncbi:MAG: lipopolysaccharide biosynthesis protein [Eubacteriales bacterium]